MINYKFVDIHTHLLPIQDGPEDTEQAIRAIRIAEERNISKIVVTPHYISGDTSYNRNDVFNLFNVLKKETQKRGIGVKLYLGNECVIDDRIIEDIKEGKALTLGGTRYVLCEYPFYQVPFNYMNIIHQLIDNGYKPIIAHPERNIYFASNIDSIAELKQNGCMIQVNAESVIGKYGYKCKKHSLKLIKDQMADIVASDAHSDSLRSPDLLEKAYYRVKRFSDEDYLKKIFSENPGNVLI